FEFGLCREALCCHLQRERSVATECFTVPDKNSNENWTISLFRVRYLLCVLVSSTSSLSSCEQVFYVFITITTVARLQRKRKECQLMAVVMKRSNRLSRICDHKPTRDVG